MPFVINDVRSLCQHHLPHNLLGNVDKLFLAVRRKHNVHPVFQAERPVIFPKVFAPLAHFDGLEPIQISPGPGVPGPSFIPVCNLMLRQDGQMSSS